MLMNYFFSLPLWGQVYFSNTVSEYFLAFGLLVVFLLVFRGVQKYFLELLDKVAKHTDTDIDDTLVKIINSFRPPFYTYIAFYISMRTLTLHEWVLGALDIALIFWITYQVVRALQVLVEYIGQKILGDEDDKHSRAAIKLLGTIASGILWVLGILFALSNLGVNITTFVAGFGIGGLAIALALQNILEDLFSSFSLYFDKPFTVGDFIVAGEHSGVVKKIGVKTTRIKALQGEEIVVTNKELTAARVQNFRLLKRRRVVLKVGIIYETSMEMVKKVPEFLRKCVSSVEHVTFDRAHLDSLDSSALTYECVYYIESSDYNVFMDAKQLLLFGILESFREEGIEFAYPTQMLHVQSSGE